MCIRAAVRTSTHAAVNTDGQLGRSDAGRCDATLRRLALPPVRWVRAGGDTSLACCTDGRLYLWGNTEYGQAGRDGDQLRTPTAAPFDGHFVDARVGGSFVVWQTGTYTRGDACRDHPSARAERTCATTTYLRGGGGGVYVAPPAPPSVG